LPDLAPWVRLSKTGASARRLNSLVEQFSSPEALFSLDAEQLASVAGLPPGVAARLLDPAHVPGQAEMRRLDDLGVDLVIRDDPRYPSLLAEIHDPPPLLYVRGALPPPDAPAVAIVGSRGGSAYGRSVAERLARELAAAGVAVVSGLARGIDAAAHRGALAGGGPTLAVLGCGVDVPYPWENRELARRITGGGALVSEYPLGAAPDAWHFPSRNRIVSGLTLGTIVVEAARGSGALITASCAVDQNREVFAVPGNIDNPMTQGPHALLRDGAKLVENVADILQELRLAAEAAQPPLPMAEPELADDERQIWSLLSRQPRHVDDLILASDLPVGQVNAALMMLEVKGLARRLPGSSFARAA
jgi:DNA processing protein